jgi:hypothetical protein
MLDLFILVVLLAAPAFGNYAHPPTIAAAVESPRHLGRWPDHRDLAKLQWVEGKTRWAALLTLGPPSSVTRQNDGVEIWDYPWPAVCRVSFYNGVCTSTYYTAGY